jgi:hypothetical protein
MRESLEFLLARYQYWRHIGEWILVAGLAGEIALIASVDWLEAKADLPPRVLNEKLKVLSEFLCAILIVVGVYIENVAGNYADETIRRMRVPRSLTAAQQQAIVSKLKPFGTHAMLLYEVNRYDPEIAGISRDLNNVRLLLGWSVEYVSPLPPLFQAPATGILVHVSPFTSDKNVVPAARALVCMLRADDLEAKVSTVLAMGMNPSDSRIKLVVYSK